MTPALDLQPPPEREDPFYGEVKQHLKDTPSADWSGLIVLVLVVALSASGMMGAIALIVALVLRDLARFTVMKLVGAHDGRLLVLPLVRGELPIGTTPGKEATIILAGPAFLMLASLVTFLISRFTGPGIVLQLSQTSVGLAAFTLLPFKPYDGWRLLNLAIFSRSVKLEAAVAVLTSLALAAIGIALQAWILTAFAVINAIATVRILKLGQAAAALGGRGLDYAVPTTQELTEAPLRALFDQTLSTFAATFGTNRTTQMAKAVAQTMREVHLRVAKRPPSAGISVLLVTVYGSLFAYFVVGLVVFISISRAG